MKDYIPSGNSVQTDKKLNDFTYETRPARKVHTKGAGWKGSFTPTNYALMSEYKNNPILRRERYRVIARGSKAVSEWGTPDTARNVTALSWRIYGDDRNYDFLNNHIPVFGAKNAYFFKDNINAFKPDPYTGLSDPNITFGYLADHPEGMYFYVMLFSDLGTNDTYRKLDYHGVNTFVWVNREGVKRFAKHHLISGYDQMGIDSHKAAELAGTSPDCAAEDMVHILCTHSKSVTWTFCIQLMDIEKAEQMDFDPLDCTKMWNESDFPLIPVGVFELNQVADAQDIDNLGFSPANIPPGIEFSHDDMLMGRMTTYPAAQRHRDPYLQDLQVNLTQNGHINPAMDVGGLLGTKRNWEPDYYTQPREYIEQLDDTQFNNLVDNIAEGLIHCDKSIQQTVLDQCYQTGFGQELQERMKKLVETG